MSSLCADGAEEHTFTRRKRSRKSEDTRVFNKHIKEKTKDCPVLSQE